MLPLAHVDSDEFERNILLMEDEGNTQSARGGISTNELENHV